MARRVPASPPKPALPSDEPASRAVADALRAIQQGTPVRDAVVSLSRDELRDLSHRVKWGYDQTAQRDQLAALLAAKG